jgi:hypothetical protein
MKTSVNGPIGHPCFALSICLNRLSHDHMELLGHCHGGRAQFEKGIPMYALSSTRGLVFLWISLVVWDTILRGISHRCLRDMSDLFQVFVFSDANDVSESELISND